MFKKYLNNRFLVLYFTPITIGLLSVFTFQPFNFVALNFFILPIFFYLTVYINKKIVSGDLNNLVDGFMEFFNSRPMTDAMRTKLAQHLEANKAGLVGAFTIWASLYQLKMSVVDQLNKAAEASPVKGYLQDGTQTQ